MIRRHAFDPGRTTPTRLLLGVLVIALWMLMLWSSVATLAEGPRQRPRPRTAAIALAAGPTGPGTA